MTDIREASPVAEAENAWPAFPCYLAQLRARGAGFTRYEYRGEIARGGMGVVHLVHDADTLRSIALKVMRPTTLPPNWSGTPVSAGTLLARFIEEAQITSQLDHPCIVPVHEIGIDSQDRVYFTMKHVAGENLKTVFERVHFGVDDWNETRVVAVLLKVCEAMAYAHWKGVIHRDLKPANIMVGRFGEVYVMDWGLARLLGPRQGDVPGPTDAEHVRTVRRGHQPAQPGDPELTVTGDVIGTPSYMAPEQARAESAALGPHSDVYSLGAMLYHLLTGHVPYADENAGATAQEVVERLKTEPPEPISTFNATAPPELVAICEKSMARRIEDRYPTMDAVAAELRAYLEHRVVRAYETGPWAALRKLIDRNRVFAGTIAALLTLGSAIGSFGAMNLRNDRDDALVRLDMAESALTQARAAEFDADVRTSDVSLSLARLRPISDRLALDVLRHDYARLAVADPASSARQAREMRNWLDSAKALTARRIDHVAMLESLMESVDPPTAEDAALIETLDELLAGIKDLERSDDTSGPAIAVVERRLEQTGEATTR